MVTLRDVLWFLIGLLCGFGIWAGVSIHQLYSILRHLKAGIGERCERHKTYAGPVGMRLGGRSHWSRCPSIVWSQSGCYLWNSQSATIQSRG